MSDAPVLARIRALLDAEGCGYELLEHDAVATAREAAAARGSALEEGAKAILLKYGTRFGVFVTSAARQIRSAKIRRGLQVKRTRFATRDELREMTGLAPGAVPPFGPPILPYPLFADPTALVRPTLVFTAGARSVSIRMATDDYRHLARPEVFDFVR